MRRNVKLATVNAHHMRHSHQPEVEVTADLGLKLALTSYNYFAPLYQFVYNHMQFYGSQGIHQSSADNADVDIQ